MARALISANSLYLQSVWMFEASTELAIPGLGVTVRRFPEPEAQRLIADLRKQNVFARHDSFYPRRVEALQGCTIIEVRRPGNPDDMIPEAQRVAKVVEGTLLLSASLCSRREEIHRRLSIATHRRATLDLTIGPGCYYLRSRFRGEADVQGMRLDEQACRRYHRCGFPPLACLCFAGLSISPRVETAAHWLVESRQEPVLSAAIVKTAIALETLLVFSESEALARALSERSAFLLSLDPALRLRISRVVKRFYDARSSIVHGSRKKSKELSPSILEGMDRLTTLLCLILAANRQLWPSHDHIQQWCEDQRWGPPASNVVTPFPVHYLRHAVALAERN